MTTKKKCETAAKQAGMSLSVEREGNIITVRIEAPNGCNFGGLHEIPLSCRYGEAIDWSVVMGEIKNAKPVKCDADTCGSWIDDDCEWWTE